MQTPVSMCVTSKRHDIMMIIAIHCDSLCTNCRFLKTGLVDHIGVLQTPKIVIQLDLAFAVFHLQSTAKFTQPYLKKTQQYDRF